MLNSLPVMLLAGAALGFLAGIGVGGGSLLILWLTLVAQMPQDTARSINLLFFLPTAFIASLFRWKKGTLHIKNVFPAILGGVLAAILFTWLSQRISSQWLRAPFGILLLVTGFREIFYRPRKPK